MRSSELFLYFPINPSFGPVAQGVRNHWPAQYFGAFLKLARFCSNARVFIPKLILRRKEIRHCALPRSRIVSFASAKSACAWPWRPATTIPLVIIENAECKKYSYKPEHAAAQKIPTMQRIFIISKTTGIKPEKNPSETFQQKTQKQRTPVNSTKNHPWK